MKKLNTANEIVVDENDLVEMFLQGVRPNMVTMQNTSVIDRYNQFSNLFLFEGHINVEVTDSNTDKYMATIIDNWYLPNEYKDYPIYDYCIKKCSTNEELQRVMDEFNEYDNRGMLPVLKYLKYMIDTMRANNIVWGVGRGSSVASYVLFLIGVHKIDSLKYNLDYKEFLR